MLVAAAGGVGGEAVVIPLFALDGADQLGLVEFAALDAVCLGNGADVVQFHALLPLWWLMWNLMI